MTDLRNVPGRYSSENHRAKRVCPLRISMRLIETILFSESSPDFFSFVQLCSDSSHGEYCLKLVQKANWRISNHNTKLTYRPVDFKKYHDSFCYFM